MNNTETIFEKLARAQMVLLPSLSTLGIITNVLNIIILSCRSLRRYSCTQYFLVLSVAQLLDSIMQPLAEIFLGMFQPLNALVTTLSCKLILFLSAVFPFVSYNMIVLASMDRFCASSSSVCLRSMCKVSVAYRLIGVVSFITLIYTSGFLVISNVAHFSNGIICIQSTASSAQMYSLSILITFAIIEPILMILFGILTIYNIRKQQRHIDPVVNQNRLTNTQLAVMLIAQMSATLIFNLPFGVVFLMSAFMSEEQAENASIKLALTLVHMWQGFSDSASFFLYTLTASLYRREFINIFHKCYIRLRRQNN